MQKSKTFGYRVLVVEDQLLIALDLCRVLEKLGCVVLGPVSSIDKALALLDTQTPDVALLDEDLKSVPVTPVAEALRQRGVPYGIISGYERPSTDDDVLVTAPRLRKPASVSAISEVLNELRLQSAH